VRYKQTALGILWAIVQPLAIMLIFTLIFSVIVRMPSEGVAYPVFAYTALLPWTFFSTALLNGTNSLVNNSQLITKVSFPREILPLSYVVAALFDFVIGSTILVALITYYKVPLTLNYI
jgi:lipopolysaccharide transport system permease protein